MYEKYFFNKVFLILFNLKPVKNSHFSYCSYCISHTSFVGPHQNQALLQLVSRL